MERQTTTISAPLPMTYWFKAGTQKNRQMVLMLHGYTDSAASMLRRFGLGDDGFASDILAPNGLFPVPVKGVDHYKEAYSWYFLDPANNHELISPQVAVSALDQLMTGLQRKDDVFAIVGFSQGGFLAPRLRALFPNLQHFVGIGCRYPFANFKDWDKSVLVHGIHGQDDSIIPLEDAQSDYQRLKNVGIRGEFYALPDLGHRVSPEVLKIVNKCIHTERREL